MRVLIAPDKFKGTLNAREVAQNIAKGLLHVLPDAQIEMVPMADGGEGTAEAVCDARGCSWLDCKAHDPLDRKIDPSHGDPQNAIRERLDVIAQAPHRCEDAFRQSTFRAEARTSLPARGGPRGVSALADERAQV